MNILVSNRWRLHDLNDKNFEIQEWRETDPRRATSGEPTKGAHWVNTGHYFQSIPSALVWLLDHRCINDQGECANLREAIEAMKTIADDLKNVRLES